MMNDGQRAVVSIPTSGPVPSLAVNVGDGALPTVIVIGAQKCGTSALHAYLAVHPEVSMSRPKELDFFIAERNWRRGPAWYRRHFDPSCPVRGESSPNYTAYPTWRGVPQRMADVVPDVRLIYLVRDPLDRIASQWIHNWSIRRERLPPAPAISRPSTYLHRSRYMFQLEQFLERFPSERILVLDQRDLLRRRIETLEQVFTFLGIDRSFRHPAFEREVHASQVKRRMSVPVAALERLVRHVPLARKVPMSVIRRVDRMVPRPSIERPDIMAALEPEALELLREDARKLRAFTGLSLSHWSV
jgi:hypothetical protein